jgi:transposase-like protein
MAKTIDIGDVASCAYWREEDARTAVAAWRASGDSLSAFARQHGVQPRRLARWSRRLETALQFHPVRITGAVPPTRSPDAIEIELPSGERIRLPHGFDAEDLRRLFSVLEADASC